MQIHAFVIYLKSVFYVGHKIKQISFEIVILHTCNFHSIIITTECKNKLIKNQVKY